MRRSLLVLCLGLGASAMAAWGDGEPPSDPAALAEALIKADAAGEPLAPLTASEAGPWYVVDQLLDRDASTVAVRYAGLVKTTDGEALVRYAEHGAEVPEGAARRHALLAGLAAMREGRAADALAAVSEHDGDASDLASVMIPRLRMQVEAALGHIDAALTAGSMARERAERLGCHSLEVELAFAVYGHATRLRRYEEAVAALDQALRVERIREKKTDAPYVRGNIAAATINKAIALEALGRPRESEALIEEGLPIAESVGRRDFVAVALQARTRLRLRRGDTTAARTDAEALVRLEQELGRPKEQGRAWNHLGDVELQAGDLTAARAAYEKARRLAAENGLDLIEGEALFGIAEVEMNGGRPADAAARLEDVISLARRQHFPFLESNAQRLLALAYQTQGELARALRATERSVELNRDLRDRAGEAGALVNLGTLYLQLNDLERGRAHLEQGRDLAHEVGQGLYELRAVSALAGLAAREGKWEEAITAYETALVRARTLGLRGDEGNLLHKLGKALVKNGDVEGGITYLREALALGEANTGSARIQYSVSLVNALMSAGRGAEALELARQAAEMGGDMGDRISWIQALNALGQAHLNAAESSQRGFDDPQRRASYKAARDAARQAVDLVNRATRGLSDEAAARAKDIRARAYDIGLESAMKLSDGEGATYFLESARALALLAGIVNADALRAAVIPPGLVEAEAAARQGELAAWERVRVAQRAGGIRALRAAKRAVADAEKASDEIQDRFQREARFAAQVLYPHVESLAAIESALRPEEALVLFGETEWNAYALVIRSGGARGAVLGAVEPLRAAIDGALLTEEPFIDPAALAAVEKGLIAPLNLPPDVTRVVVSPAPMMSAVPLQLLLPGREVVYVPSGSILVHLRQTQEARGTGVLAVGDPDYTAGARGLAALTSTRAEVEAIGTRVLVGESATVANVLTALGERPRWRGVHFACHGLLDVESPMRSSLALTPTADDPGELRALDIMQRPLHADLVVLAACESARGTVTKAEGVLGLTRAVLHAGAPRVICALWKVDDEATSALMRRFYELWHPDDDGGLDAARALVEAQAFVRDHPDHPEWKHPYYWAPWVLWGLPN